MVLSYVGQILEQSFLMFPLVLGIYLSFTVLKIADLTVDGSLLLGAAVFAKLTSMGVSLFMAMTVSALSGMGAGIVVSLVQLKNRIDPLIAGILMAFILHSSSLVVMQRPNIGLLSKDLLFDKVAGLLSCSPPTARLIVLAVLVIVLGVMVSVFLSRRVGLWLKAFGNNQDLVALLGRNPETLRMFGLAIGNGLAALSGCLIAQASGYADISMGFGQALIGIAMILLGRQLLHLFMRRNSIHDGAGILFTLVGVVIYFILTNEVIRYGLSPIYLKMAIGVFLIVFLFLASDKATHGRSTLS